MAPTPSPLRRPQAPAQATPGVPPPGVGAPGGSPPILPLPPGCALSTPDCQACSGDGCACRSWPYARCWAGRLLASPMPATPVIPEEQERDAIEDALEKDMNHYLANAPNLRGRCDDHLPLAIRVEQCRTLGRRLRTLGQWVRHKVKLGAGGNRPAYQALKSLATRRHRSSTAAAGSRSE
jgi:hypothetical protein